MKKYLFFCLFNTLAALVAPSLHADILTSGNFQTGTPTPTLNVSAAFTSNVTATGGISSLALDEWVINDGTGNSDAGGNTSLRTWSYQIDNGAIQTFLVSGLIDNSVTVRGALTPNDGELYFNAGIGVSAGQTITFFPTTLTFSAVSPLFNPPPARFVGEVFGINSNGQRLTANAQVPEPSIWAMLGVGAAGAGFLVSRRRACS